jgi:hypothetical protein
MSFLEAGGGKPPPQWVADTESGFATIVVDPREMMYHDLPEEEGNLWVSKLEKQSLKALSEGGEYAYAGWRDVPAWFLATVEDQALPFELQQYLIKLARDENADVVDRKVNSSHSPMLSQPKETAKFLKEAIADFVGKR